MSEVPRITVKFTPRDNAEADLILASVEELAEQHDLTLALYLEEGLGSLEAEQIDLGDDE